MIQANITHEQADFLLQSLLEYIPDTIYFKDLESRFILINHAAAELFKLASPEDAVGKTDFDIFSEEHASAAFADEQEIIRTGIPIIGKEEKETWPNGTISWATTTKLPLRNNKGEIVGTFGISRNITERMHAIEQIAEQAALIDIATDAIMVCDLQSHILFWNKGAEQIYGWVSQEVLGQSAIELLYPKESRAKYDEILQAVVRQGKWKGEVHHVTKDRKSLLMQSHKTLVQTVEGQPKSLLIINTDITEKKKIEAHFLRAQRMESVGTLAGGIAHDLNNILAPILMSIGILKLTATDPQTRRILDTIESSSKRGADIVRQVLSFARGVEGERIEVDPNRLLKDIDSILKDTFPKNILLKLSLSKEPWSILGDPTQMQQILLNLCVNARDAMPHGGSLSVAVENTVLDEQYAVMHLQAKAGRYVTLSVTDSGTGIPSAILDKIFEPFFTTKEVGKGTGLGLSTVLAIVKSHGGFINVYSEPGNGTSFKVYLPAMEATARPQKETARLSGPPRGRGELVLIVDDEISILTITSQTLEAFGYRTLMAHDGAEAVGIYAQHRDKISVVLTDMAMPIMDGPATIRALMKINPDVKIIAASGLKGNGSGVRESEVDLKYFLAKPYTSLTLLTTLRAILDEP